MKSQKDIFRYTRQCTILKTKVERLEETTRRSREMLREKELISQRIKARLKYENDTMTIEIGKLQTSVALSAFAPNFIKMIYSNKAQLGALNNCNPD